MKLFFNSYIYKRSTDLLWALHVVINSTNKIIVFFLVSKYLFHFTVLWHFETKLLITYRQKKMKRIGKKFPMPILILQNFTDADSCRCRSQTKNADSDPINRHISKSNYFTQRAEHTVIKDARSMLNPSSF